MKLTEAALLAALTLSSGAGCAAGAYCDAAESLMTKNCHASLEYVGLALQADPQYDRAFHLLQLELLKQIAMEHEAKVASMAAAENYELAVADCDRVAASAHLAGTLPGGDFQIYHEQHRAELAGKAAEKFYLQGLEHQAAGDARRATHAFRRALGFRVGYKDARARYESCLSQAKVRLLVRADADCEDAQAVRALAEGIPRAARSRGLQFLEFVSEGGAAAATCLLRAEAVSFHDTGWQAQQGQNEVWVAKRDPNTGRVLTDQQGNALQVQKRASWTTYQREVVYQAQFSFQVQAAPGQPAPTGSVSREGRQQGAYARWQGDPEAAPDWVRALPSSPVNLKPRGTLATECAGAAIDELAHQLFLAYEK